MAAEWRIVAERRENGSRQTSTGTETVWVQRRPRMTQVSWVLCFLSGSYLITAHFIKVSKEKRTLKVASVLFLWGLPNRVH